VTAAVQDGYALGVDLGTSNTVAVLRWPDGRTRPLLFDGVPILPSAVYHDEAGLYVGRDALRMAALQPSRLEPNPKRRIDEPTVLLGSAEVATVDLLAAILNAVSRAAVEAVGFLPPAILTCPASWGPARREVLRAAAVRAGWPPVRLVPEPVAAARYFTEALRRPVPAGGCLAVFDFGGGTLDIAVVRNDPPNGFTVIGDGGIRDLGGLDVDAALMDHLGRLLSITAPQAWAPIAEPDSTVRLRERRQFWDDVRGAKEMLSRAAVAPVAVPGMDQAVHLTREELDRIAGPLMQRAVRETAEVVARCGLRPDQLVGLFLVGGSSRLPIVARLLHAQLGIAPTVLEQPEMPVAEGALVGFGLPASAGQAAGAALPGQAGLTPVSGGLVSGWPVSGGPADGGVGAVGVGAATGDGSGASGTGGSPYQRRIFWIVGLTVVVVLALVAALFVVFRNGDPEPHWTPALSPVGAKVPMGPTSPDTTFTAVLGDQAWMAYQDKNSLVVIGYDLTGGKQTGRATIGVPNASSVTWKGVLAGHGMLLAFATEYDSGEDSSVYAVTTGGKVAWHRGLGGHDNVFNAGTRIVVQDEDNHQLLGLDPASGTVNWTYHDKKDQYGDSSDATIPVITDADLSRPETAGRSLVGALSDHRLVQIDGTKQATIVNTENGNVATSRGNIAGTSDLTTAYDGHLYVATYGNGYTVTSYDLDNLGRSKLLYSALDETHAAKLLYACGGRVCVVDETKSDSKTDQMIAVNSGGGTAWTAKVPGVSGLDPIGDSIVAYATGSGGYARVYDKAGTERLGDRGKDQLPYGVNGSSLLLFSNEMTTDVGDQTLTGLGLHSHTWTALSQIKQIRGASCSWNQSLLVCPEDTDFGIWRFAS
jgi:hypothetical protein